MRNANLGGIIGAFGLGAATLGGVILALGVVAALVGVSLALEKPCPHTKD
jgi:hypothetical protein